MRDSQWANELSCITSLQLWETHSLSPASLLTVKLEQHMLWGGFALVACGRSDGHVAEMWPLRKRMRQLPLLLCGTGSEKPGGTWKIQRLMYKINHLTKWEEKGPEMIKISIFGPVWSLSSWECLWCFSHTPPLQPDEVRLCGFPLGRNWSPVPMTPGGWVESDLLQRAQWLLVLPLIELNIKV